MNDTAPRAANKAAAPGDPVMATADPAIFAALTSDENHILAAHLMSGWYKQPAVHPGLLELRRETGALVDDLSTAWWAAWHAGHEPEAGS